MKLLLLALLAALFTTAHAKEAVITIPKTGTNLTLKLIYLIDQANGIDQNISDYNSPNRTNQPYWLHIWRSSSSDKYTIGPTENKIDWIKKSNIKVIIVLRDPRSLIFSICRKDKDGKADPKDFDFALNRPMDRLSEITGDIHFNAYPDLSLLYYEYLQWGNYPFTYTAYFENLVGPLGGGSRFLQISEIMNIAEHIGKPVSKEQARSIADNLFGSTITFQTGQVDSWKTGLTEDQINKLDNRYGPLVEWLGYPSR